MKKLVLITTILSLGFADTGEGVSELVTLDTVDPTVHVLAPNGGENYVNEEFIEITWSASDFSFGNAPIKIYFSEDGGETYTDNTDFEENDGIYQWTVPDTPCIDAVVRITAIDEFGNSANDESDNSFSYYEVGAQISISPSSLSFDINLENSAEETQTLTITNSGDVPLEVAINQYFPVVDIDGNVYQTIQIGDQIWMAENLKVTHYNDGTEIPTGYSNDDWANLSTDAYAVYDDNESNADTYGYMYNWYAVETDNLAPEGWHVPTDEEWTALSDYLGGSSVAGGKMKECTPGSCPESEYWNSPNTGATNESGFTGLPAGYREQSDGTCYNMGSIGYFWSSSENYSTTAWNRPLNYHSSSVHRYNFNKRNGFSVRCLGD
mgnify:CR=1 FL=1